MIVHIDWMRECQTFNHVYYKEVLTTRHERWEEKTWDVLERLMDSSPWQRAGTQRTVCQEVSDEAQDPGVGTSTLLVWPSPVWPFFIFHR
jgi:hypothetical protein